MSKILFATNENDGEALAEMNNLRDPLERRNRLSATDLPPSPNEKKSIGEKLDSVMYLLLDVVERIRRVDGEADQNDVRVRVRKRAKTIVILLASSIPQGKFYMLSVDFHIRNIVLKDRGNIDL